MKILAIDTTTAFCSVSILEDDKIIDYYHAENKLDHSRVLIPVVKELMEKNNLTFENIDILACSKGPGSFTGIRIGVSAVNAFSDAKNIKKIGINTLEALTAIAIKQKNYENQEILAMVEAKGEEVYAGVYKYENGELRIFKNPEIMHITETVKYVDFKLPLHIIGCEDKEKIDKLLSAEASRQLAYGNDINKIEFIESKYPISYGVGIAAREKAENEDFDQIINPLYLRKPQSERNLYKVDEKTLITEMGLSEFEYIRDNYEDFPNSWDLNTYEDDFKNSKYFVSKIGSEVLGFVSYKEIIDEIEIINIVTRKTARNMGIASSLLSYIIRNIKTSKIKLEVNEKNINAIRIYKSFGFKIDGMRKKYYNSTDDAILMSL